MKSVASLLKFHRAQNCERLLSKTVNDSVVVLSKVTTVPCLIFVPHEVYSRAVGVAEVCGY